MPKIDFGLIGQEKKASVTLERRRQKQSVRQNETARTILRKKRSKEYLKAAAGLDAGVRHNCSKAKTDILDALRKEFPDVELEGILLGIVSKCYLGDSYEVHTLNLFNSIVQHYKFGQPLPDKLENARALAASEQYACVEVYQDCMRAIDHQGRVAVIPF